MDPLLTSKMPSEAPVYPTQPEKPHHYTYLKEFRTQQCPLFLQHKCNQHRPFTCFHWHFLNQRRRRPVRRRDGTFNYNPDVYCTKYDETTGICPDGDECPYLHRTAGDTERRYHLRYYKTGNCVHETDSKGHCVKNGPHCAFAHGAHDLRQPVYDIREIAVDVSPEKVGTLESTAATQLEKDRQANEDPKWNDTNYVLANYKTEPCKRPPRLCRQGYACPSYHNSRDRRRTPKKFKYRSTPCPNVKHGDDWGDPAQCDNGDGCPYCHTRTEQQFHPEIYKSTKCNDMVQTGYCPRGPFCAFAHVELCTCWESRCTLQWIFQQPVGIGVCFDLWMMDIPAISESTYIVRSSYSKFEEMTTQRELGSASDNSLAAFVTNALPPSMKMDDDKDGKMNGKDDDHKNMDLANNDSLSSPVPTSKDNGFHNILPEPIGKGRSNSMSSSLGGMAEYLAAYGKAPGSEREDAQPKVRSLSMSESMSVNDILPPMTAHQYGKAPGQEREDSTTAYLRRQINEGKLRQQMQAIEDDATIDPSEKMKRKQNLLLIHSLNLSNPIAPPQGAAGLPNMLGSTSTTPSSSMSTMSPHAQSFYPAGDTVESVIGNALEEDLNLGELSLSCIERDLIKENDGDANSVCSSYSAGFTSNNYFGPSSMPVTIPSGGINQRNNLGSLSQSPVSASPLGSLPNSFVQIQQQHRQEQQLQEAAVAFLSQPNPGKYSAPGYSDYNSMSPRNNSVSQSPLLSSSFGMNGFSEVQRLREELASNKAKMAQWEEGIAQARSACEAWKKEAEESARKAKISEEERAQAIKQRDEAVQQVAKLKQDTDQMLGGPYIHCLQRVNELETLPVAILKQMQAQLRVDLETLEKAVNQASADKCLVCQKKKRNITLLACNHYVMCDSCASKQVNCPFCHTQIPKTRPSVVLPM